MAKLRIKFHPSFWIFLCLLLFSNNFLSIISYLLCVFLHEIGHSLMASFLGYKLNQITLLPFGASLSGKENVFYKPSHEILVAISGPMVNLLLVLICLALFWCVPISYSFLNDFYYANLITLIFNFLPVYPLDGGRVLYSLVKRKKPIKKAYKIIKIIGVIVSILLFILFIITSFFKINFTIGLTSIFLITGIFFEDKSSYYVTNFSFVNKKKKLTNGLETNVLTFNEDTILYSVLKKLNKFKYNVINIVGNDGNITKILSEEEMENLLLNNSLDSKIKEIKT